MAKSPLGLFAGRILKAKKKRQRWSISLYKRRKLGLDKKISLVIENAGISNGLGFSNDLRHIYHTNSINRTISKFEFDADNSRIGNGEIIVTTPNNAGVPDGMTVDADDCIWSARWDGWALYRYDADGEEIDRINFEVKKVSCPTFGGTNYEDIYVTTAGGEGRLQGRLAGDEVDVPLLLSGVC